MASSSLSRLLAILLLVGVALLAVGAVMHPVLVGQGEAVLRLIADTPNWRAIHLTMLAGSGLVIAGIWVRVLSHRHANTALIATLAIIALGIAINALDVAYMAGSGTHLAEMFRAGRSESVAMFEVTHPIGLMSARFGNFIVAIGALALGFVEREDSTRPRWIAWLAWLAAAGGFVGVLFFDESSRMALAAVSLLMLWEVATAALVLRDARAIRSMDVAATTAAS